MLMIIAKSNMELVYDSLHKALDTRLVYFSWSIINASSAHNVCGLKL